MLEVYTVRNAPEFYISRFCGQVYIQDAIDDCIVISDYFSKVEQIKKITIFDKDSVIVEKDYIKYMGEFAIKNKNKYIVSYIMGVFGVRKIFYKMFLTFSNSTIKRILVDSIQDVEKSENISISSEMELLFTNKK